MEMRDKILAIAQRLVQQRGFNGFSYADIAEEVGIRKASLHHYFPSKSDLGLSLIEVYSEQLGLALLEITNSDLSADKKLETYVNLYRCALVADCICLGGMLATEAMTLDPALLPSLKRFFQRNVDWLTKTLLEGEAETLFTLADDPETHARLFMSALQGTLLISRATNDRTAFEQTARLLVKSLLRKG
jgi:TetR/AcrR family transcriptional regulator, transcriptional repressor for nem operon